MSIQKIKIVTFSSLLILLCLQVIWSVYTYNKQQTELHGLYNKIFHTSALSDVIRRSEASMPEGTEVDIGQLQSEGVNDYSYLQEALSEDFSAPLLLSQLDSTYRSDLLTEGIRAQAFINRINPKTGELLESTDPTFRGSWGSITTNPEYLRRDSTEAVVAVVVSPVQDVLRRVWLLYFSSIMLIGFAGWGLYYQIKIILAQDRLSELRKTFSNTMVHDMKTPISSIMTGVGLLRHGSFDSQPKKKEEMFDMVEHESLHLLSLVNKVLTIAKIESGKFVLERKRIRLRVMVDALVEKYPLRSKKYVTFNVGIPKDAVVYADPSHLAECLSNLIENAEKYSGKTVHVDISYVLDGSKASIRVADNGIGIPQNKQALIFEKFERVSAGSKRSANEIPTGFGLGLNYVQLIMKEHGGGVTVQSEVGRGSAFTLTFPASINR
jgi:two-component system phosphate regulon sensor histidine kinase PhoR